ncbi:MAG: rRNA pseudouridine synthase [Acidiferrobacterales bacterium]|nr:rRNA pseudouridine synthase [Acidiferrobacterales bacterium]
MSDKIQKLLAHAGYGSRREIEKWISLGRITVNGKRAKLGDRASNSDRLLLDGKLVDLRTKESEQIKVLIYHKPEGQICSRKDPKGRPTIFDELPAIPNGRWVSVGRLDINTSGLILLTNNGELANRLMHPSTGVEREYLARIRGLASEETIKKLTSKGVMIDGKAAYFERVTPADLAEEGTNHWYRVVIREGRYREVRRMWDEVGHTVSRLKRIRYGSVKLPRDIKLGKSAKMAPKQIEKLVTSLALDEEFKSQLYSSTRSPVKTRTGQGQSAGKDKDIKNKRPAARPKVSNKSNSQTRVKRAKHK